ncbi:hypothetical protein SLS61_010260 [Didymella pomorum]
MDQFRASIQTVPAPTTPAQTASAAPVTTMLQHAFDFLRKLDRYTENLDCSMKKPKKFSSGKDALQTWIFDCLHYLKANGKNYQYDEDRVDFLVFHTDHPARQLLLDASGLKCVYDNPFDVLTRLWQVYGEADTYGAAERAFKAFTFPRFGTTDIPDAAAAFAVFRTQMERFALQLQWSPDTHFFRLQAKLPMFARGPMATVSCERSPVGLNQYYDQLATFMSNYSNMPRKERVPDTKPMSLLNRTRRRQDNGSDASTDQGAIAGVKGSTLFTSDTVTCYNCGGKGHKADQCSLPKKPRANNTVSKETPKVTTDGPKPGNIQNRHITTGPDDYDEDDEFNWDESDEESGN